MSSRNLKIIVLLFSLTGSFSCSKKIDLVNPNGIGAETYNKNVTELTKSTNAAYAVIQATGLIGRRWIELQELRADESKSGGGQLEAPEAQVITGTLDASNAVMADVWPTFYVLILRCNTVIDGAPKATGDDATKNRLVAEAKFLRAWAYWQLATLWGPVPLYKNLVSSVDQTQPRSPVSEIYDFAIQDLKDAEGALPDASAVAAGRVSKGAAQALLGWVYLQRLDYTNALVEFQKVIDSKLYSLVDNYADNFLEETEYNKESIFEIGFQASGNFGWGNNAGDGLNSVGETTMRNQDFNGISWRNYIPSDKMLMEYENTKAGDTKTDPRLHDAVYFSGDTYNNGTQVLKDADQRGDATIYYGDTIKASWKKYTRTYKTNSGYDPGGINYRMLRYGNILLMAAECEIEAGHLDVAMGYLNQLRNRKSVSMPNYPTTKFPFGSPTEAYAALMHEKHVETAAEEVRNFDLLRWRKAGKLTKEPLSYYQAPKFDLLPIPQAEMANNPKIGTQNNPGY